VDRSSSYLPPWRLGGLTPFLHLPSLTVADRSRSTGIIFVLVRAECRSRGAHCPHRDLVVIQDLRRSNDAHQCAAATRTMGNSLDERRRGVR